VPIVINNISSEGTQINYLRPIFWPFLIQILSMAMSNSRWDFCGFWFCITRSNIHWRFLRKRKLPKKKRNQKKPKRRYHCLPQKRAPFNRRIRKYSWLKKCVFHEIILSANQQHGRWTTSSSCIRCRSRSATLQMIGRMGCASVRLSMPRTAASRPTGPNGNVRVS